MHGRIIGAFERLEFQPSLPAWLCHRVSALIDPLRAPHGERIALMGKNERKKETAFGLLRCYTLPYAAKEFNGPRLSSSL